MATPAEITQIKDRIAKIKSDTAALNKFLDGADTVWGTRRYKEKVCQGYSATGCGMYKTGECIACEEQIVFMAEKDKQLNDWSVELSGLEAQLDSYLKDPLTLQQTKEYEQAQKTKKIWTNIGYIAAGIIILLLAIWGYKKIKST